MLGWLVVFVQAECVYKFRILDVSTQVGMHSARSVHVKRMTTVEVSMVYLARWFWLNTKSVPAGRPISSTSYNRNNDSNHNNGKRQRASQRHEIIKSS